jgi:hypothetical protein
MLYLRNSGHLGRVRTNILECWNAGMMECCVKREEKVIYNRKDTLNPITPVSQYSNIPIAITSSFLDIQARPSIVD